jgi:hypothetical protein
MTLAASDASFRHFVSSIYADYCAGKVIVNVQVMTSNHKLRNRTLESFLVENLSCSEKHRANRHASNDSRTAYDTCSLPSFDWCDDVTTQCILRSTAISFTKRTHEMNFFRRTCSTLLLISTDVNQHSQRQRPIAFHERRRLAETFNK